VDCADVIPQALLSDEIKPFRLGHAMVVVSGSLPN
jgi:hypothetical protein